MNRREVLVQSIGMALAGSVGSFLSGCGGGSGSGKLSYHTLSLENMRSLVRQLQAEAPHAALAPSLRLLDASVPLSPTLQALVDGTLAALTPDEEAYLHGLHFEDGTDTEVHAHVQAYLGSHLRIGENSVEFVPSLPFTLSEMERIASVLEELPFSGGLPNETGPLRIVNPNEADQAFLEEFNSFLKETTDLIDAAVAAALSLGAEVAPLTGPPARIPGRSVRAGFSAIPLSPLLTGALIVVVVVILFEWAVFGAATALAKRRAKRHRQGGVG